MEPVKVADMHCDTISALRLLGKNGESAGLGRNGLSIDLEKLKAGGYTLQTFALFASLEEEVDVLDACMEQADLFYQEMEKHRDLVRPVSSWAEIEENQRQGRISALLSIEGGEVCHGNFGILRNFYRLGVRMMTLTWNFENELASPQVHGTPRQKRNFFGRIVPLPHKPGKEGGLSETGIAFLYEMERLGMIIDVSHLSDAGFWDVQENTARPFVASHSNARALAPHPRNLTDDMIRRLSDRGGVLGLNFYNRFLSADGTAESMPVSSIKAMVAQLKYITNIGGMGCVGLGTDFDGIECEVEIGDASGMQLLAQAMREAGFHEAEIEGVFYRNVLRVYREILG